jgi:hypothetical protein
MYNIDQKKNATFFFFDKLFNQEYYPQILSPHTE